MSEPQAQTTDRMTCPKCLGVGTVKATRAVEPWGTWQQRVKLAESAKPDDRWIRIKSGRVVTIREPCGSKHHGCIELTHESGQKTTKWVSYFAQEFTPETPPK